MKKVLLALVCLLAIIVIFSTFYKRTEVYLDNNGTTFPYKPVVDQVYSDSYLGNPSAIYADKAKQVLEGFRSRLKNILNAPNHQVIVTSCGSESNNLIIRSCIDKYWQDYSEMPRVIIGDTEHKTSLLCCEGLQEQGRVDLVLLPCDSYGHTQISLLPQYLTPNTCLVSVMHINNETGSVNDIKEASRLCREAGVPFHSDIVQSFGKIPPNLSSLGIRAASISMHKLHGPLGVGALVTDLDILPQISGMQNQQKRGGTENIPQISGSNTCLDLHFKTLQARDKRLSSLKRYTLNLLDKVIGLDHKPSYSQEYPDTPRIRVLSPEDSINTILFSIVGPQTYCNVKMREHLYKKGIIVSIGSTCNTQQKGSSHVLKAMNIPYRTRCGILRVSFSGLNTFKDCNILVSELAKLIRPLSSGR